MGVVLAFAAGYFLGAKAGREELDEVLEALQAIRRSEEFNDLVRALRSHAASALREVAALLDRADVDAPDLSAVSTQDLVERVKALVGRV
jgi:hypothetical protein